MATTFKGSVKIEIKGDLEKDQNLGAEASLPVNYRKIVSYDNGSGDKQANMIYKNSAEISASGSASIDLSGALSDAFGDTISFTKIKSLLIVADEANGGNLSIGGEATNPLDSIFANVNDEVICPPNGSVLLQAPDASGYSVTNSTADILEITNLDGAAVANYDIVVIGVV